VTHVGVTGSAFDLARFIVVLVVCCKTMTFRSATVLAFESAYSSFPSVGFVKGVLGYIYVYIYHG
jgi:hypothetical protein